MNPNTLLSLVDLIEELETIADSQNEFAGTSLQSAHPMSEAYADSQTTAGADFRFVQLHSNASETYLQ
jgi:hypothetical protein